MTAAAVGLDIGGQFVKGVLVSAEGAVLATDRVPTGPETSMESLSASLAGLRDKLVGDTAAARGLAVGVGIAGVIGRDGTLHGGPHLPLLVGSRIAEELSRRMNANVAVHNDADCAAMAEGWHEGAAAGRDDFLMIAIGTGVGSGLVLGGRLRAGMSGYGCELGHMTIVYNGRRCGCGNLGCLEAYISETAALHFAEEASASLRAAVAGRRATVGGGAAQALFELGAGGNEEAEALAGAMVEVLGAAIGSAVNVLDLTTIVLGGGIAPGVLARAGRLARAADSTLFARPVANLEIVAAARGPLAGAIGAARLGIMHAGDRALSV
ncbi:MAG TPA: ROK family protein [Candidatus Limnocylindrales bacterium]|nr:ROK family protein [Candidatus Limnocylindrales bacterium]